MEFDSTRESDRVEARPRATPAAIAATASPPIDADMIDPPEHNVVFTSLVTGDKDIVGLVAYSIYKQNKYDWLMAFSRHLGRMPTAEEAQSYLHGESTPRRLATYRHLAEATLDGRGLEVPGSSPRAVHPGKPLPFGGGADRPVGTGFQTGRPLLIGLICVIVVVTGFIWFFHGGASPK